MRLNLRHLWAMSAISASVAVSAQSITTSPAIITEDSKDIVITFHSDGGTEVLSMPLLLQASTPIRV